MTCRLLCVLVTLDYTLYRLSSFHLFTSPWNNQVVSVTNISLFFPPYVGLGLIIHIVKGGPKNVSPCQRIFKYIDFTISSTQNINTLSPSLVSSKPVMELKRKSFIGKKLNLIFLNMLN